jgi:CheY-like chemotaxis protein
MKRRVLLAEDDPGTIDVMCLELGFLGYEVTVATDGIQAVEKASAEMPDIILMDIRLPKMNGFQAMTSIRENPKTQSIPLLASTAMAMPGDKERCLAAGFNGYIAKPFTHKELGAALEGLLKDSQAEPF